MENPTIKEFLCKIEETNATFKKSTKAEKRVMIVEDCLKRIQLQMIIPLRQRFLSLDFLKDSEDVEVNKEFLNSNRCQVCAKGALFASYVGRTNNFLSGKKDFQNDSNDKPHIKLSEIFSHKQLSLIEFAFEGEKYLHQNLKGANISFPPSIRTKARDFYIKNGVSEERLIAICENIIRNKGTFIL